MTNEEAIKRIQQDLDVNKKYLSKEYKEALNMAIEALSADAVSREFYEEAIKANHGLAQELCELKASADRPSGVWKLASEELPQSVGSYIVTCKDEKGWVYVDYDFWTVANEFKYNCSKVIAWIPFPKPYCGAKMKGGEDE